MATGPLFPSRDNGAGVSASSDTLVARDIVADVLSVENSVTAEVFLAEVSATVLEALWQTGLFIHLLELLDAARLADAAQIDFGKLSTEEARLMDACLAVVQKVLAEKASASDLAEVVVHKVLKDATALLDQHEVTVQKQRVDLAATSEAMANRVLKVREDAAQLSEAVPVILTKPRVDGASGQDTAAADVLKDRQDHFKVVQEHRVSTDKVRSDRVVVSETVFPYSLFFREFADAVAYPQDMVGVHYEKVISEVVGAMETFYLGKEKGTAPESQSSVTEFTYTEFDKTLLDTPQATELVQAILSKVLVSASAASDHLASLLIKAREDRATASDHPAFSLSTTRVSMAKASNIGLISLHDYVAGDFFGLDYVGQRFDFS